MYHQGLPSSYGPQSTWGIITLDSLKAIKTLPGSLGHILVSFKRRLLPITPVGALEFQWFGKFPNTEEDVFYVQLPLPDGIEWKIRIFPSGSMSISSFGYFLQPVGNDGVPRVPHSFNVRLASGGPPIDSWEQRFTKCLNITSSSPNQNEKWYFKEGQKVVVCQHKEFQNLTIIDRLNLYPILDTSGWANHLPDVKPSRTPSSTSLPNPTAPPIKLNIDVSQQNSQTATQKFI
ncbi:hypothetical protein EV368DRAFT_67460 [Lentinula lateritia]|nr:hypothetical protein EV368DRAFT_67460 [Lentinula lateritia]